MIVLKSFYLEISFCGWTWFRYSKGNLIKISWKVRHCLASGTSNPILKGEKRKKGGGVSLVVEQQHSLTSTQCLGEAAEQLLPHFSSGCVCTISSVQFSLLLECQLFPTCCNGLCSGQPGRGGLSADLAALWCRRWVWSFTRCMQEYIQQNNNIIQQLGVSFSLLEV